jgi:transposase InsO family protein
LRKQLALYEEREVKPRRAINATRIVMVWLSHCFDWRAVLYMVTLETFIRWQRQGVRWFWRQKAKPNRPALPKDLRVLKTPVQTPVANSICERVIGTLRQECLDFVLPLHERHLYGLLKEWVAHYNEGRPHLSWGPGIPQPRLGLPDSRPANRHSIPTGYRTVARPILSGLHHDYRLEQVAA